MPPPTGRLAPSPTGELHLGNLSSLVLAWVHARATGARLILRIEDLDPPRCVPGADVRAAEDLRWVGVEWDEGPALGGPNGPYHQSERGSLYRRRLDALRRADLVYPCFCSRRDIRDILSAPHSPVPEGTQYPGTCAGLDGWERASDEPHAIRFRAMGEVTVEDRITGKFRQTLDTCPGDFVVRRRDGLFAYQFAVVVDDIAMGVTDIVRGRDLLDSTPRQFALFDALGGSRPTTWHVPLLMDQRGERLSKRARAVSRAGLAQAGWGPESLRGLLAWIWGWTERPEPLTAEALVERWDPAILDRETLVVPDAVFEGPDALSAELARE